MKKFYLFFLFAAIAVFTAKADVQIFTVSGTVYENPNVNPVPGHPVTIEIPPSNVFDGYFNEVLTNEDGEYIDEVEVPEALMQAEVLVSTIDCDGYMITEMYPFYQGLLSITCDFIICDEPFPDCWATWDYQPSPNDPFTIMFFDESFFNSDVVEWFWQFGDGSGSGEQNPVHTFGGPGIYPVCLTISTPDCEDIFCMDVNVEFIPPGCQAFFEWIPMEQQTIHFIDMSDPPPTTWFWDFGDNTFSDEPAPIHYYQQPGEYVVCLTIFNEEMNCEDTFCQDVWVEGGAGGDCQAYYTWWPMDFMAVEFLDLSNFEPGEWMWEFGDGEVSSEPNPVHYYFQPGIYPVCLTIYGENCVDVYCEEVIVESPPNPCDVQFWWDHLDDFQVQFYNESIPGTASDFNWDFGDGNTSTEPSPLHQYEGQGVYEVCLHMYNPYLNCENTLCQEVWVGDNFGCQAAFDWVPLGDSTYVVQFYDTSTGSPVDWMWEFGDGIMANEQNPVHSYNGPGTYVVCLTVMDAPGQTSTYCEEIIMDGSYISGIEESGNELVISRVFPNPANNFVNLEISSPVNSEIEITLISLQGKEIQRSSHSLVNGDNQLSVDVSVLSEGVYLLRVQSGNSLSTTKIKVSK